MRHYFRNWIILFLVFGSSVALSAPSKTYTLYSRWGTEVQHPADFNTGTKLIPYSFFSGEASSWENLETQLTSLSQVASGDQVILMIDTHGAPIHSGQQTHSVQMEDGLTSLDVLIPYLEHFASVGADIALIDQSCYSSPTLSLTDLSLLLHEHLCVITGDSVSQPAFATFSSRLNESIQEEISIEDWFKEARIRDTHSTGTPSISTEAGKACGAALSELQLVLSAGAIDNFHNFLKLPEGDGLQPKEQQPVIQKMIQFLEPIVGSGIRDNANIEFIYSQYQGISIKMNDFQSKHPDLYAQIKKTIVLPSGEKFTWADASNQVGASESWGDLWVGSLSRKLLVAPSSVSIQVRSKIFNMINEFNSQKYDELVSQAGELEQYLRAEKPNFEKYFLLVNFVQTERPKAFDQLDQKESTEYSALGLTNRFMLSTPERELYELCYKSYLERHPKTPQGPCQRIKLHKN